MLIDSKCKNCGAKICLDDEQSSATCEYCGSTFLLERNGKGETKDKDNIINLDKITNAFNNMFADRHVKNAPPRPKLKLNLFIFLMLFWFFPAIVYAVLILVQQSQWDSTYAK